MISTTEDTIAPIIAKVKECTPREVNESNNTIL